MRRRKRGRGAGGHRGEGERKREGKKRKEEEMEEENLSKKCIAMRSTREAQTFGWRFRLWIVCYQSNTRTNQTFVAALLPTYLR